MLKKRILASSMASVMALASVASTAVTAFADDATTTASVTTDMAQHDAEALKAYIEEVKKSGVDINQYGTYSIEAFNTAMKYAEAQTKVNDINASTVAYQMLKAVFEGLEMHTKEQLQALMDQAKPIVDNNNVWCEDLDDSRYTADSFDKLSEAYAEARSKIGKTSKDINDAWENLDNALKSLQDKDSVSKAEFNSKFKAYDDQLKRFGAYESWRRGQVKPADGVDVGDYKDLKVTWGALHNHINSSYNTIRTEYEKLNAVKSLPESKTYDEDIVKAYKQIQTATNILASFVPDDVTEGVTASAKTLDKLVDQYKGRILYTTDQGQVAVQALSDILYGQKIFANDSDRTNNSATNNKEKEIKLNEDHAKKIGWHLETTDDGTFVKLSAATYIVKVDAPFGIKYDPTANGWTLYAIDGNNMDIKTKTDIDNKVKVDDDQYKAGWRGYSFSQTEAKKGIDLTKYVDIPSVYVDAYASKSDKYTGFTNLNTTTSFANATVEKALPKYGPDNEDRNYYQDSQFGTDSNVVNPTLLPSDKTMLDSCTYDNEREIANSQLLTKAQLYGVAPNILEALELWNVYRKESSVVRNKDNDDNFDARKEVLGQAGTAVDDGRYTLPNDASLVSVKDNRISIEEYELAYRYIKYALSDAFDGDNKNNNTYKQLNEDQIERSYDIFDKTKDAELFTAGHSLLGEKREASVELVRAAIPAGRYTYQLANDEQTDFYDALKDAIDKLQGEYDNFAYSYGDVYDLIAKGAKALDDGNANVNAALVSNLAKSLAYIQTLIDSDGDEVELENSPFSDNGSNLIRYHRVFTYDGDGTASLRRPDDPDLKLARTKGKNGEAQGVNYTHYNLTQAYKALEAALNAEAPAVTVKLGDVNNDGKILANDAVLILKKDAGVETFTEDQAKAADVNKDDKVNVLDAVAILKHIAGVELITD